tara:strand:+ start:2501 stop:2809 length:309 start_codon:yes stop_codon:yes gene_type:complete
MDVMDGFSTEPRVRDRLWLEVRDVEFAVSAGEDGRCAMVVVELPPKVLQAIRGGVEGAAAHLLWCMENDLTDVEGAKIALRKLLPSGSLERFNESRDAGSEE